MIVTPKVEEMIMTHGKDSRDTSNPLSPLFPLSLLSPFMFSFPILCAILTALVFYVLYAPRSGSEDLRHDRTRIATRTYEGRFRHKADRS